MLIRLWERVKSINLSLVAAALFAAGILHILATLAAPHLVPSSGYGRLAGDLPENKMQILAAASPDEQPLPFFSPDARYAVCRFDTRDGAVDLTAVLPEPGWVLGLFSPDGDNFFTSVGAANRRPDISLRLVPGEETWHAGGQIGATMGDSATLTLPANEGIAIIRAPDRGEAYRARMMAELKRATCSYRRTRAS